MNRLRLATVVSVVAAVSVGALGLAAAARRAPAVAAAPVPVVSTGGTAASPVTWRVRSTGDGAVDAVLGAYQRYLGTAVRVAETPDPADPALPVVATGARLAEWRAQLAAGPVPVRGPVTASATVLQTGPARVALHTCTRQAAIVSATVVLVRVDAAWRVASVRSAAPARCR